MVGTGNTSVIISKSGNIILPANGSITDSVGKPVVETSVTSRNILNINIDGGIAAAIFSAIDNVYDGGGTSAAYGTYAPALDGADAYTDYSQTIGLDGGGAFAF